MADDTEQFVTLLTKSQASLYAYILSLVLDHNRAEDLLQETNLTLWRKVEEFEPRTNFQAWACQVAYFKVLSFRRRMARDRHVFDDQLLDYLAERQAERMGELDGRRANLRDCLKKLPEHQRELIELRYRSGASVQEIAQSRGRSVGVISQTLYRIRTALENCVRTTLTVEEVT